MIQPSFSGIEQMAKELAKIHGLEYPATDPVLLANRMSITVHNTMFPDPSITTAMTVRSHTSAIFVDNARTNAVKKHAIAHMIGHHFLHQHGSTGFVDSVTNLEQYPESLQTPAPANKLLEFQANVFAAALLIPEEFLRTEWEQDPDPAKIAKLLNTPVNLTERRAKLLGLEIPRKTNT